MSEDLYKELEQATRDRQTALNGLARWQVKLQEAETNLAAVAGKLAANVGTVTPPVDSFTNVAQPGEGLGDAAVFIYAGSNIPADYPDSAE